MEERVDNSACYNTATLVTAVSVIPAKAGIQIRTGFRVKPGMTNRPELCRYV